MSEDMEDYYTYCLPTVYAMTHVAKVGSVFTTLAVSLERYFAVCRPLWIHIRRCHPANYIVSVVVFAVGFNIPKFMEFEVSFWITLYFLNFRHLQFPYQLLNKNFLTFLSIFTSSALINFKLINYIFKFNCLKVEWRLDRTSDTSIMQHDDDLADIPSNWRLMQALPCLPST